MKWLNVRQLQIHQDISVRLEWRAGKDNEFIREAEKSYFWRSFRAVCGKLFSLPQTIREERMWSDQFKPELKFFFYIHAKREVEN